MSMHFAEEDLTLNDNDLPTGFEIFSDAVTSDAFICTVSLVTIR